MLAAVHCGGSCHCCPACPPARPPSSTASSWHLTAALSVWVQGEFRVNQHCKILCRIDKLDEKQAKAFQSKIGDEYRVNM